MNTLDHIVPPMLTLCSIVDNSSFSNLSQATTSVLAIFNERNARSSIEFPSHGSYDRWTTTAVGENKTKTSRKSTTVTIQSQASKSRLHRCDHPAATPRPSRSNHGSRARTRRHHCRRFRRNTSATD